MFRWASSSRSATTRRKCSQARISPSTNLDFIADQLRNLRLQVPESPAQQEEQPPPVCAFVAGLEKAIHGEPLTLARHLSRNVATSSLKPIESTNWVHEAHPSLLPDHVLPGFPTGLRNTLATHSSWLQQATVVPTEPRTKKSEDHNPDQPNWSKQ